MKVAKVPFIANPNSRCVPCVFGMALAYFDPDIKYSLKDLEDFCGFEEGMGTWKAKAMLNLSKLGYKVHWIELFDYEQFANDPKKYLRSILDDETYEYQSSNTNLEQEASRMQKYIDADLPLENRKANNDDIKRFLDQGWLVHLEVNAAPLNDTAEYVGHSVLVIGYDDKEVTIQNPDRNNGNQPNQRVSWQLLDKAWKEFGGTYSLHAFKK